MHQLKPAKGESRTSKHYKGNYPTKFKSSGCAIKLNRNIHREVGTRKKDTMSISEMPRSTKTSMKRQRSHHRHREIGWATALLVCVATLQSISTVEYGHSFVFPTPPTTAFKTKARTSSTPNRLWARGKPRTNPWELTEDPTVEKKQKRPREVGEAGYKLKPGDAGYKYFMDHRILTMDEEYELGIKIRKFIDTKEKIDAIASVRTFDQRMKEIDRRRGKEVEKRKKRKKKASKEIDRLLDEKSSPQEIYSDDLSMEEEFLMLKGRDSTSIDRSRVRRSIEELYGYYDDDDEEEVMEELGMGIYGVDTYANEENLFDDPSDVYSAEDNYEQPTQLFGTLNNIRLLTERDITEELGIEGGHAELTKIMIDGALAKQELIKSNTRLVKSIAQKWMGTSKGSGLSKRFSDKERSLRRQGGDWTTPAMDEVIQSGIYGLAKAAERFQPDMKFKFSTYATYYITNEVRKIFQSTTTQCLYVPPYFYLIRGKYEKIVRDNYSKTLGQKERLSIEEIARTLELKPERLEFILRSTRPLVELDSSPGKSATQAGKAGGNDSMENSVPLLNTLVSEDPTPEQIVETSLLRQCIENALAVKLLPLERDVVRLRHGLDDGKSRTVKEVMKATGGVLTLGDVRNLEQRAYKKLRFKHSVHAARLLDFAEDYMGVSPELLVEVS